MAISNKVVFHDADFGSDRTARDSINGLRRAYIFGPIRAGASVEATGRDLVAAGDESWRGMIRAQQTVFQSIASLSTSWRMDVCSKFRPVFATMLATILANNRISAGNVTPHACQPWPIECSNGSRSITKTFDTDVLLLPIWVHARVDNYINFEVDDPQWRGETKAIDDEWCGCWYLKGGTPIVVTVDDDAPMKNGLLAVMLVAELR